AARQPVLIMIAVGLLGAGGVSAGGYYAYRTYDYVQHDNDFCMSCHLMAEPYELFAESAHRGLGCKACHQPGMIERTSMALTQVVESPDTIAVHATVSNEACATCHIEGDPEAWRMIAASAGHRVHLESDDPSLDGVACVQCHSSSLHQFTATDETCGQSGCHTDVEVQLGRMGDFTIHCAACHGFSRVIDEEAEFEDVRGALAPTDDECLSCHVMRTLVDMPPDEPHDQVCATCHNPHEQTTPLEAEETCATVGCHDDVRELSPFHRGLDAVEIEQCGQCHGAHDWMVDGNDCLACHTDVFDDAPGSGGARRGVAAAPAARAAPANDAGVSVTGGFADFRHGDVGAGAGGPSFADDAGLQGGFEMHSGRGLQGAPVPLAQDTLEGMTFLHGQHRAVECTECHVSTEVHGAITVTQIADCRSCHHTEAPAEDCSTCHAGTELAAVAPTTVSQQVSFSVVDDPFRRDLPFEHEVHTDSDCTDCHQQSLPQTFDPASCATCHTEHHGTEVTCMACHALPVESAHTVENHVGCTGVGCHEEPKMHFEGVPRQNQACLVCHQDLTDHRPGESCAECHQLTDSGPP
ncbi:MAG: hypothetical protein KJP18_00635, partial [Gemmatimonadetes bacterium]|nr:hypothetical protein [Gemmatimonadota bacterium]